MSIELMDLETWSHQRIRKDEKLRYFDGENDFIPEGGIEEKLRLNSSHDPQRVRDILAKSLAVEVLEPDETAFLLNVSDQDLWAEMRKTALEIKKRVYDNRIVTFAPLYLGNYCINNCLYCGFRKDNLEAQRRVLSFDEIRSETAVLNGEIGHKRLVAVYGEHPLMDIDYIVASIRAIYDVRTKTRNGRGDIRRVSVNAPPMTIGDLKKLPEIGIGTYQVFQETYHRGTYARLHPKKTLKADFHWRLYAMHRAMEAGIEDVGIGALFGLYDWKFEVMGLLYHARELEERFGTGPHTISFPRLEPALNAPFGRRSAYRVSDEELQKVITVLRLSVPYAGLVLTARENPDFRREGISLGITQMDASARIGIGAYSVSASDQEEEKQQFLLGDTRTLDEMVRELAEMGHITSFCTSGYRCGRRGKEIIRLLRKGVEGKFCKLNAVLTFREWLDDFATPETRVVGKRLIEREISEIRQKMGGAVSEFEKKYERIREGERDLHF